MFDVTLNCSFSIFYREIGVPRGTPHESGSVVGLFFRSQTALTSNVVVLVVEPASVVTIFPVVAVVVAVVIVSYRLPSVNARGLTPSLWCDIYGCGCCLGSSAIHKNSAGTVVS